MKTNNKNPSIFVCKTQVLSSNPNPFPQSTEVKIPTSNFKQQNNTERAKGYFSPSLPVLSEPSLRSTRSQGYLRDARTEVIPCSPLGTLWQPSQKLFSSGDKWEWFPKARVSCFCQAAECPCLAAEQRVWLMKRCQNDNPCLSGNSGQDVFFLAKSGAGGKSENKTRKRKGKQGRGRGFEERKQ